ncbi:MAG: DNA polymerase III subunit gamma/tau [Spirochaetaceae bacterium]|nr:MAG: DNA polymerase III subunit gamma/tau [Spirochaetaceae bacterium]
MNYEVTALKKRPQTFDDLHGQDFVVATLKNSLDSKRIANAYLFSGPRGVGKTSAARILAKALNCEKGVTSSPCGVCSSCTEIAAGNALDVIEIDGASHTSVNDVRQIRDEVLFSPSSCRYKIYIIDEVHMLSNSAFNALLKTIEEPPPYIVFIFATTEIHKVPATIRSRCQQFTFRLIAIDEAVKLLEAAAKEQDISSDRESLIWIARESTGSMRDAYTLFDQIVSFSDKAISIRKIQEKLGIVGLEETELLVGMIAEENVHTALEKVNEIIERGISEEQVLISLSEYFRNLLLLTHNITKESVLGFSRESFNENLIHAFSAPQIEKALLLIFDLLRNLRFSLNQKFEVELLVQRLCGISRYITQEEILNRIDQLKRGLPGAGTGSTAQRETTDHKPAQARQAPDKIKQEIMDDSIPEEAEEPLHVPGMVITSNNLLHKMTETIGRKKLALASALDKHDSSKLENSTLLIFFKEEDRYSFDVVTKEKTVLGELASEITASKITVKPALIESRADGNSGARHGSEDIIKKVFKGSVVDGE